MKAQALKAFRWSLTLAWSFQIGAQTLSLDETVTLALEHAAEIKSSRADLDAQRNKRTASWLDLGPRLSATYNHAFFDNKLIVPFNGQDIMMRDDVTKTGSLVLTQPLTGLFALSQKARLEGTQKEIKQATLNLTESQVAFRAAELFMRVQQNESLLAIAKANSEAAEAQLKDGRALLNAERIHKGDFLKLELALSQAGASMAKANAARDIALFSLKEMVGLRDDQSFAVEASREQDFVPEQWPSLEQGIESALSRRMELKQARLFEQVASVARMATFSKFLPSVNFFAQMDKNFGQPGLTSPAESKFLGFNCSWDFFNSGAHIFEVREASFAIDKAMYQKRALTQQIRINMMQTLTSLKAAHESLAFSKKAVEQANEAYRIERLQFSSGRSQASLLVLAQTAKTVAESNLVSVIHELKIEDLKLQQALGEQRPRALRRN